MTTLILRCNKCRDAADMLVGGHCLHCEPKTIAYTVRGIWPFPVDMLRHDYAVAATAEDKAEIERMSGTHAESREDFKARDIKLIALHKPNTARWESFGWSVPDDVDHAYFKALRAKAKRDQAVFDGALAKLTEAERSAVTARMRHVC